MKKSKKVLTKEDWFGILSKLSAAAGFSKPAAERHEKTFKKLKKFLTSEMKFGIIRKLR